MKIVSAAEMREIDRVTSERFRVSSITLMENAGTAVARFILSEYPQAERVGVLCGKGNNGGDGFVVARKLSEAGRAIRLLLLCDPGELRGDAATMFQNLPGTLRPPLIVREASWLDSSDAAEILSADVIVDALLGTGFRPPVSPLYAAAIEKMNAASATIVAVDIPSGADADATRFAGPGDSRANTGDDGDAQARADAIVTFTAPHPAHVFAGLIGGPGGPTVIAPIGSPPEAIVSQLALQLSTPLDFAPLLAPREREGNKGSYGHVLVIGGSLGKAGAAAMAGYAALRAGAGLSTVATPLSVLATVASFHPEVMTEPLAETDQGTISLRALGPGLDALQQRTLIAIGPGISRHSETAEFVRAIVKRCDASMVVDADALNAFEGSAGILNGRGRTLVVTPHPGEMSRLTGLSIPEIQANRLEVARNFARQHELIVVLKGHRTLIAAPDGTVWVNPTGNPGMATGGTGDMLTGMVAGLIAQHPQNALEATALAVYLHGLAGDLASESVGENSLVATDLVRFLPAAFAQTQNWKSAEIRLHF